MRLAHSVAPCKVPSVVCVYLPVLLKHTAGVWGLLQCKTACDDAPSCTSVYYDSGQQQCYLKQGECIYNDTCVVSE